MRLLLSFLMIGVVGCSKTQDLSLQPNEARAQIQRWIPVGTSVSEARRVMMQLTNGSFATSHDIDFLYCDRREGGTRQRWQVALVHVEGKVSTVLVTIGTVAP